MGGTITGEHGVGAAGVAYMAKEHGPALDAMRAIKNALDPKGIMNPGELFPDEEASLRPGVGGDERQISVPHPDGVSQKPRHEAPPFE